MKKIGRLLGVTLLVGGWAAGAQNSQSVHVNGAVVNQAVGGGHAIMNVASTKGGAPKGRNRQQVDVKGALVNAASQGARSELNVASGGQSPGSRSQVVSIDGPIVTGASGRGVNSTVNIGGR